MPDRQNNLTAGERQLMEAQQQQAQGVDPELERQARAAGFNSYAEMQAYMMQKARKTGGSRPAGGADGPMADSGASRSNPLSWHPRQLLDYVNRKWSEAMR